jgi:hypothetical protein
MRLAEKLDWKGLKTFNMILYNAISVSTLKSKSPRRPPKYRGDKIKNCYNFIANARRQIFCPHPTASSPQFILVTAMR